MARHVERRGGLNVVISHPVPLDLDEGISVPKRAEAPPKPPFPLIACLAPLLTSGLLWVITHSPFALVFALLSPVIAVSTMLDAAVHRRRAARTESRAFAALVSEYRQEVERSHDAERSRLARRAPSADDSLRGAVQAFSAQTPEQAVVRLGIGPRRSAIRLEGAAGATRDPEQRRLRALAANLDESPILSSAPPRIAVLGPDPLAHAIARGYLVQLASALTPASGTVQLLEPEPMSLRPGDPPDTNGSSRADHSWIDDLPHAGERLVIAFQLRRTGYAVPRPLADAGAFVVAADSPELVPVEASIVVRIESGSEAAVVRHPDPGCLGPLSCEYVSVGQAEGFVRVLKARAAGLRPPSSGVPDSVDAGELVSQYADADARRATEATLSARLGLGASGPVCVDLVAQGPHAIVGGTTGSGKSELLVTWVADLARTYSPAQLTVLLVDFKGGSAFDPLTPLDHCVGLITDLDPHEALRALTSLRAEIRHREGVLREAGARDIADSAMAGRLPRLVVVVDEFAAMLSDFPELHDVFVDIAARGRSLGMHLILCTQRPAGIVRDALLANCDLRLSLRMNNAADSVALLGGPAASTLAARPRGRCYLAVAGSEPHLFQVAQTSSEFLDGIERGSVPPRRPWLPALPTRLLAVEVREEAAREPTLRALQGRGGIPFGRLDLPHEQSQPVAVFDPPQHGPLLILGAPRSGKSTALQTLVAGAQNATRIPSDVEGAWDELEALAGYCGGVRLASAGESRTILGIDDLDSLLASFDADYQPVVIQRLSLLLRDGPARGLVTVATGMRLGSPLTSLAPLFSERILLRLSSRQEHLLAEGDGAHYDPSLPPGAASWSGRRLQFAITAEEGAGDPAAAHRRPARPRVPVGAHLVVTTRPGSFLEPSNAAGSGIRTVELGDRSSVPPPPPEDRCTELTPPLRIVADPDAWLAHWPTFSSWRSRVPVLYDACSLTEYRSLSRRRDLPPPVAAGAERRWLATPDGAVRRA